MTQIKQGMVLAAGKGERMRPLTNHCPKPLLQVAGRTMLDRALDAFVDVGVERAVVNTFYLGDMIDAHLKTRRQPQITIVKESSLLDTGGGVKNALPHFSDQAFFVVNGDVIWTEGSQKPALSRLAEAWDDQRMDLLLLLYPSAGLPDHAGPGDYFLQAGSMQPIFAKHPASTIQANMIFTGPRIVHPRLFAGAPDGAFSFLDLFHKAEKSGRLSALVHDGGWYHVGTPEALAETEHLLAGA